MEIHQRSTESDQTSIIHFVESTPSVLQEIPWIQQSKEEVNVPYFTTPTMTLLLPFIQEQSPSLDFEQARLKCRQTVNLSQTFSKVELVYGHLGMSHVLRNIKVLLSTLCCTGDGKTHHIKEGLSGCHSTTIAVNEAFSVVNAINKLRKLPPDKENCIIYFNFTLLSPGVSAGFHAGLCRCVLGEFLKGLAIFHDAYCSYQGVGLSLLLMSKGALGRAGILFKGTLFILHEG